MNELRDARPPAHGAAVPSPQSAGTDARDALYTQIAEDFGAAIERLARAYEQDHDRRRDLLQEIHLAIWRSLALFDRRCSLRTWVYRVAHNTTTSQIVRRRTKAPRLVGLDEIDDVPEAEDVARASDRRMDTERLLALIHTLEPVDRQIVLLYLEGIDAASIGEITGLSSGNVATKVHRLKKVLTLRFHQRGRRGE